MESSCETMFVPCGEVRLARFVACYAQEGIVIRTKSVLVQTIGR